MPTRPTICLLCGGQSTEHEVSLMSARNVLAAISRDAYEVLVVGIDKGGTWFHYPDEVFLENADDACRIALASAGRHPVFPCRVDGRCVLARHDGAPSIPFDVIFPVLHGINGEDGAVQGLAQMLGCRCVGCGILASAVCMDKAVAKQILEYEGIHTAPWITVIRGETPLSPADVIARLGLPLFVKPANTGSSVGVVKVTSPEKLQPAVDQAMLYDRKVLIEQAIAGREIECAVLGNENPFCALPGEIIPKVEFYSYEAKYTMADGAQLKAPADLDEETSDRVRALAARAYSILGCRGMARVDFFLRPDGSLILNELNTIPGFTKISMYPRLMGVSGTDYPTLIDRLIRLAMENG